MVVQCRLGVPVPGTNGKVLPGLSTNGPPPSVPSGSMVPDMEYTRLGSVGPMIEQW
jgi:hypothetical protein